MTGWRIFRHSVLLVLRNWLAALKIGLLPLVGVVVVFGTVFGTLLSGGEPRAGAAVLFLVLWVLVALAMLNIVVNWHRFVLLEEYPESWIPRFHGGLVLGYFGRLLMLALLGILLMLPVGIVLLLTAGIADAAGGSESGIGVLLLVVLGAVYLVLIPVYYRLAVILPSGAIEKPLTLGQAWARTEGATGAIVVMVLLLVAAQLGIQGLAAVLVLIAPIISGVVSVVLSLGMAMVGVSILTTLYGHYVEGRPID